MANWQWRIELIHPAWALRHSSFLVHRKQTQTVRANASYMMETKKNEDLADLCTTSGWSGTGQRQLLEEQLPQVMDGWIACGTPRDWLGLQGAPPPPSLPSPLTPVFLPILSASLSQSEIHSQIPKLLWTKDIDPYYCYRRKNTKRVYLVGFAATRKKSIQKIYLSQQSNLSIFSNLPPGKANPSVQRNHRAWATCVPPPSPSPHTCPQPGEYWVFGARHRRTDVLPGKDTCPRMATGQWRSSNQCFPPTYLLLDPAPGRAHNTKQGHFHALH